MTHTCGDWTVVDDFGKPKIKSDSRDGVLAEIKQSCKIKILDNGDTEQVVLSYNEMIANARIMAAAPSLLIQLKDLVWRCKNIEYFPSFVIRYAEQAIEKATGEQQ